MEIEEAARMQQMLTPDEASEADSPEDTEALSKLRGNLLRSLQRCLTE